MAADVVLLGFGEPPNADEDEVRDYLERIFLANAAIESDHDPETRARQLADRRTPSLIEEYDAIGGSPLNRQLAAQADRLESELADRGLPASTHVGLQFTEPFIDDTASAIRDRGGDRVIGLPVYPLCGASTSVAALSELRTCLDTIGWNGTVHEIPGWHTHPTYNRLRAENVESFARDRGIDLHDEAVRLVFSAHGTPQHYLDEGSRYEQYVEAYCAAASALLDVDDYDLGYQNHENRDVPWTEPSIDDVIRERPAETVVIEPVSFMHEQSETLSELDRDVRSVAENVGMRFHRVPIPHADPRFPGVLADLVEPFLAGVDPAYYNLHPCRCRKRPEARCLNATAIPGTE